MKFRKERLQKPFYKNKLPTETLNYIIDILNEKLSDETIAPGEAGKKAYMKQILSRIDFFPDPIMEQIYMRKSDLSVIDFLYSHSNFNSHFWKYRPSNTIQESSTRKQKPIILEMNACLNQYI